MIEDLDELLLEESMQAEFHAYFPSGYRWDAWREQEGLKEHYLWLKKNKPIYYFKVLKPARRKVMIVLNGVLKGLVARGISPEEFKAMVLAYTPGSAAKLEKELLLPIYKELRTDLMSRGILILEVTKDAYKV